MHCAYEARMLNCGTMAPCHINCPHPEIIADYLSNPRSPDNAIEVCYDNYHKRDREAELLRDYMRERLLAQEAKHK